MYSPKVSVLGSLKLCRPWNAEDVSVDCTELNQGFHLVNWHLSGAAPQACLLHQKPSSPRRGMSLMKWQLSTGKRWLPLISVVKPHRVTWQQEGEKEKKKKSLLLILDTCAAAG